jgi:hypothetical protein
MAQIEESVARYLHQLDSADRQEPSLARTTKTIRVQDNPHQREDRKAERGNAAVGGTRCADACHAGPLTDPDARSMATSGRGSGVVGYNVQVAVDTKHHLIVTHEVTNVGNDRSPLASVAEQTKDTLETENLDVVADEAPKFTAVALNELPIALGCGMSAIGQPLLFRAQPRRSETLKLVSRADIRAACRCSAVRLEGQQRRSESDLQRLEELRFSRWHWTAGLVDGSGVDRVRLNSYGLSADALAHSML